MAYPSQLGSVFVRAALLGLGLVGVVGAELFVVSATPGCVSGTTPNCDGSPEAAAACSPLLDGTDYDGAFDAQDTGTRGAPDSHPHDAAGDAGSDAPSSDAPTSDAPAPASDASDATTDAPTDAGAIADAAMDVAG
jgi:hypothetical protein